MKNVNTKFLSGLFLIVSMLFISMDATGQNNIQACRDSYNRALIKYKKGQLDKINNDLAGCIKTFNANRVFYGNEPGKDVVFHVYKLIISSYERIKQGGLAVRKKNELKSFYTNRLTNIQVDARLNSTLLTPI